MTLAGSAKNTATQPDVSHGLGSGNGFISISFGRRAPTPVTDRVTYREETPVRDNAYLGYSTGSTTVTTAAPVYTTSTTTTTTITTTSTTAKPVSYYQQHAGYYYNPQPSNVERTTKAPITKQAYSTTPTTTLTTTTGPTEATTKWSYSDL